MELEDLAKRIEWLEKEHRKDRATIADLQEKVVAYEGNFDRLREGIKDVNTELGKVSSSNARIDQFDLMVTQYRTEFNKALDDLDKRQEKYNREQENRRRTELDNINKSFIEVRASIDALQELRKAIQARVDEDSRLARSISDVSRQVSDLTHIDDELRRSIRTVDEARKNDIKRIADIQGELAAIRKRADDARERADLTADTARLLDSRVNEIMASEADRRQAQKAFIEQQNLSQVDRDRGWKEMQSKFESFARQTANLDQQIATLEDMQRSVKRSQEAFDDINTRLERRVKEITEIQRLAEDRIRQEWVTFKADDQKRWTNFSLTQDEVFKDVRGDISKINERIADIDEIVQVQKDLLEQTTETTETQLQELMNWAHEWLSSYERIMGRARPGR